MTVGSLFAGIGGFELAAEWAGFKTLWSNEIDPKACMVLRKNFPGHRIIEADIKNLTAFPSHEKHIETEAVDIIVGGFP